MANANSEQPACRTDPFDKEEIQPPLKLKQVETFTADLDEKTVPHTLKKNWLVKTSEARKPSHSIKVGAIETNKWLKQD